MPHKKINKTGKQCISNKANLQNHDIQWVIDLDIIYDEQLN